ncbi:restriction endonuclease subunit S [Jonquetella anthropi]|uniref:restriction endonuclease subunit S n=1 Tax=Jonquetella anthropi TaxID=428712 RepID=UPI0001B91501|nr:restriction endonuclease subunit S [Jonquetella anthropi]EEX47692.1 type I restriction modification DNA specificity domain protein [Jonquetella anthropi E3_33 E1]
MPETTKKPALRFAGFSDEWEERKINDVANFSKGNGYSKGDLKGSGTPIILYGRLYTKYQFEIEGVDTFADIRSGAVFSKGNEVIVPASGETAEDIARAAAILKSGILLGGDLNILHPFTFMNPSFVALVISNGPPQKELARKAQGKSIVHIHNSDIQEVTVRYPDRAEQDKISRTFSKLDHLIALHERKYSKLMNVKKFMLEKMFPKDSAKVPALRFAGFSGEWEKRKLGEVMKVTSVKRIHQSDWTKEGVRFLRARDIVAASKNETINDCLFISKEKYEECSLVSGKVSINDLLVTGVGTIGVPFLVRNLAPIYFKDGNIIWFKNEGKIDGEFLLYSFSSSSIQNFIATTSGLGTVGTYTIETGEKTPIILPSIQEEKKIGQFLSYLDHLLSLHRQELERLQNVKKSCLEKMFA